MENERVVEIIIGGFSGNEWISVENGITWWPLARWTPNHARGKGIVHSFLAMWVTNGLNKN